MFNLRNYVSLSGWFVNQPEKTISKSGKSFFKNRFKFSNPTEGYGYINVVAFGELVNGLADLYTSNWIQIEGVLEHSSYLDQAQTKKYVYQLIIKNFNLIQQPKIHSEKHAEAEFEGFEDWTEAN